MGFLFLKARIPAGFRKMNAGVPSDFSFGTDPTGRTIIRHRGARFFGVTAPMTDPAPGTFAQLAAISAIARLIFSAATCLALPLLRRRMPPARFRVPGGLLVPLAATALSLWLLSGLSGDQAAAGAVAVLVGLVLFLLFGRRSRVPGNNPG